METNLRNFTEANLKNSFQEDDPITNYEETVSIIINSIDRYIQKESTFNYNIDFGTRNELSGSIPKIFKNIKKINISNVIMPNFYVDISMVHSLLDNDTIKYENNTVLEKNHLIKQKKLSDLQYILLKIKEFNLANHGTNNNLNESFCVLINDNETNKNSGMTFNYDIGTGATQTLLLKDNFGKKLLPCQGDQIINFKNISANKNYFPSVKGTINNLEISFHLPNGNEIQLMNDYLEISEYYYYKNSAKVASTENIDTTAVITTIDGITLANKDIILLKDQTNVSENGPYTWDSGNNELTKITDIVNKTYYIEEGTSKGHIYRCINNSNVIQRENAIKLKTTKFFSSEEYKISDTILIKSIEGTDLDGTINSFLKRDQGHTIINFYDDTNTSNSLYNTIVIPIDSTINLETGIVNYNDSELLNNASNTCDVTKSYLVNTDLQHIIQLDISTEKYITNFKSKLL